MSHLLLALVLAFCATLEAPQQFTFNVRANELDLTYGGVTWLRTKTAPYDAGDRDRTYKVYTHIFDFDGDRPITKGPGGKYTHHRGMFIGWNKTSAGGETYDTWHMSNCYQEHVAWLKTTGDANSATQAEEIAWRAADGKPILKEVRTITAQPGPDGVRLLDFRSELTSMAGPIKLRGDLQHAGMQIRMDNEVSTHPDSTQYLLPEGAKELEDDKVVGAWWVCCSPVVREKRYWLVHMTPKTHPTGLPVYSIRRYARFGAFFEPNLEELKPLELSFRVVVSDKELDTEACEALHKTYTQ